ncbi:hypothetical protein BC826DRAFT_976741 [Russula brevipes]|nr:hypothetical protein BC826DRAFT_976741 [Russula brevipes]
MPITDRSSSPSPVPPPMPEESLSPPPMLLDAPVEELASPPPEPHTALNHDPRETAPCGDNGEPTWTGGPGHNLDMCTAPLTAFPRPEVAITSEEDAVDRMFSPQSYFQDNTQRALWHLGDYGVAADAWRLFSVPQQKQTLTERRLRVLKLEALAQIERQGYEEACGHYWILRIPIDIAIDSKDNGARYPYLTVLQMHYHGVPSEGRKDFTSKSCRMGVKPYPYVISHGAWFLYNLSATSIH